MKKIRDYVQDELDLFRSKCNFTKQERQYFDFKAKDLSNVEISLKMNISTSQTSKIAKRVQEKISKINVK